jgi:hypothetical protein
MKQTSTKLQILNSIRKELNRTVDLSELESLFSLMKMTFDGQTQDSKLTAQSQERFEDAV